MIMFVIKDIFFNNFSETMKFNDSDFITMWLGQVKHIGAQLFFPIFVFIMKRYVIRRLVLGVTYMICLCTIASLFNYAVIKNNLF